MIETKVVEIDAEDLQDVINDFQSFGWTVLSSQPIARPSMAPISYSSDLYRRRRPYYSVTFQRNNEMEHYKELYVWFEEFETHLDELCEIESQSMRIRSFSVVLTIIGVVIGAILFGVSMMIITNNYIGGIVCLVLGVATFLLSFLFGLLDLLHVKKKRDALFQRREYVFSKMKLFKVKAKEFL